MRRTPNLDAERVRVRSGQYATTREAGNNGMFILSRPTTDLYGRSVVLMCIVSDGAGWEHVSVSVKIRTRTGELIEAKRTPTWEEMCDVKSFFWDAEEPVIQYHPRASEYRNWHKYVLHLWRPTDAVIPEPNADFVAPRPGETEEQTRDRYRESA
jgi:hypothetical protein